jgi:hypothetical protein
MSLELKCYRRRPKDFVATKSGEDFKSWKIPLFLANHIFQQTKKGRDDQILLKRGFPSKEPIYTLVIERACGLLKRAIAC